MGARDYLRILGLVDLWWLVAFLLGSRYPSIFVPLSHSKHTKSLANINIVSAKTNLLFLDP